MKEREAQVEIIQRKKEMEKIINQKYLELGKETIKLGEEKDILKKIEENDLKTEQKKILKEQNQEAKLKYIYKLQEEKNEGEVIKKKAIEEIEKEKILDERRRQKMRELKLEIFQENEISKV